MLKPEVSQRRKGETMKCNSCGYDWLQDLEKDKEGNFILDNIVCPRCGVKDDFTLYAELT